MRTELIGQIARLAGLEPPDPESEERLARDLGRIVDWFDSLPAVAEAPESEPIAVDPWRARPAGGADPPSRAAEGLLEGGPRTEDGWVVVPAIRPMAADEE